MLQFVAVFVRAREPSDRTYSGFVVDREEIGGRKCDANDHRSYYGVITHLLHIRRGVQRPLKTALWHSNLWLGVL